MGYCGMPFIYHPQIWWPQHIVSHHQYTGDDALDVDLHQYAARDASPGPLPLCAEGPAIESLVE